VVINAFVICHLRQSRDFEGFTMARLIVDFDGKVTIPPEVIKRRGLHPGDQLALVESADGLLVYEGGVDQKTADWWAGLSEQERLHAVAEGQRYQALSEEERERIWGEARR
jgi:bifunctional DNA-binding transcriptional regulator/antitoxin component of YhaV-PrlF toxin-antitoxin module